MNEGQKQKARRRTRAIIHRTIADAVRRSNKEQREIAAAIGVDESYMSLLMNGKRVPSFDVLSDILTVCGRRLLLRIDRRDRPIRAK